MKFPERKPDKLIELCKGVNFEFWQRQTHWVVRCCLGDKDIYITGNETPDIDIEFIKKQIKDTLLKILK